MGRRSKLTPELRERIERELASGVAIVVTAQRAGVSERTLTRWLAERRVVRQPAATATVLPQTPVSDLPPVSDEASLSERLALAEPGLVRVILEASRRGSWQASAWILERTAPERWARPAPRTARPGAPSPAVTSVFDEIDELAAKRRKRGR